MPCIYFDVVVINFPNLLPTKKTNYVSSELFTLNNNIIGFLMDSFRRQFFRNKLFNLKLNKFHTCIMLMCAHAELS